MPGPAPKDPAARRRRNKAPELLELPAKRTGRAPKFPLDPMPPRRVALPPGATEAVFDRLRAEATAEAKALRTAELAVWRDVWTRPQAVAWEADGVDLGVVARYCRFRAAAELRLDQRLASEARQLEDRLGLSPMALKRLGWKVATDELAPRRTTKPAKARTSSNPRRVRAVE